MTQYRIAVKLTALGNLSGSETFFFHDPNKTIPMSEVQAHFEEAQAFLSSKARLASTMTVDPFILYSGSSRTIITTDVLKHVMITMWLQEAT